MSPRPVSETELLSPATSHCKPESSGVSQFGTASKFHWVKLEKSATTQRSITALPSSYFYFATVGHDPYSQDESRGFNVSFAIGGLIPIAGTHDVSQLWTI